MRVRQAILVALLFLSGSIAVSLFPYNTAPYTLTSGEDTCSPGRALTGSYKFLGTTRTQYYIHPWGYISFSTSYCENGGPFLLAYFTDPYYVDVPGGGRSTIYYGEYSGASPIDSLLQIQSTNYIMSTWVNMGYAAQNNDRLNTYQAIVATDNTDTYVCYIYPDAAGTSPRNNNGGLDWTTGDFYGGSGGFGGLPAFVGFYSDNNTPALLIPDSFRDSVRGIDGVPGDGPAAIFTGTHLPGQFCFVISGSEIVYLGPATINSPSSGRVFTPFSNPSISFVNFAADRLLVSKGYTLFVNGNAFTSLTSNRLGRVGSNLNLSSFPDGTLTLSLVRNSDSATVSVSIVKDTSSFVSITYPTSAVTQANVINLSVGGRGEVSGTVVVTIQDSSASTPDIVRTATVDTNGNWGVGPLDLSSQSDGVIRITAVITDPYGNTFTSNEVTISKDTTVTVAILTPASTVAITSARASSMEVSGFADTGSSVVVNVNDADSSTPAVVSPSVQVTTVGTWSTTVDVSPLRDGLLTFIAVATDSVGNIASSAAVTLTKDTLVSASISTPISGSTFTSAQAAALVISGSGENGGRVSLTITGSATLYKSTLVFNNAWTITVNVSALGNSIVISGSATDASGNSGSLTPVSITKIV